VKLFEFADKFIKRMTWKDMALVKACLFAAGLAAGLLAPKKARTPVLYTAAGIFAASCIPLLVKLVRTALDEMGAGHCRYSFEGYGFAPEEPEK